MEKGGREGATAEKEKREDGEEEEIGNFRVYNL